MNIPPGVPPRTFPLASFRSWLSLNEASAPRQVISHLTHIEDLVWTNYQQGATDAVAYLRDVANVLKGHADKAYNLSVKVDGAPAIVVGRDPDDGQFFVATKSALAKTPRVAKSLDEIDRLYGHAPGLVDTLRIAFTALSTLNWNTVLQGDLMFVPSMRQRHVIDGVPHVTFKPNTIVYGVPEASPLGQRILTAMVGIAFHTTYTGSSLTTLRATPGADVSALGESPEVLFFPTRYQDVSGSVTLTAAESRELDARLTKISKQTSTLQQNTFLAKLKATPVLRDLLMRFQNRLVRDGQSIAPDADDFISQFVAFLEEQERKDSAERKTSTGKAGVREKYSALIGTITQARAALAPILVWQQLVIDAKQALLTKLNLRTEFSPFLQVDGELTRGEHEGFVASDRRGGFVKLVDRSGFSRLNLTQGRFQTRPSR